MPNLWEAAINTFNTFVDNEPKPPMHVGEVLTCWSYLALLSNSIAFEESGINTTSDSDVKETLQQAIKLCESQSTRLRSFLKEEGVPLPTVYESKPDSEPNDIPLGVKLTDDELANSLALKTVSIINLSSEGIIQSVRIDIGAFWLEFFTENVTFGANLKALMRKRSWLKIPPYYYPPGLPNHSEG